MRLRGRKAPGESFDLDRVGRETELADRNKQTCFMFRVKSKFYSHIAFLVNVALQVLECCSWARH